MEFWQQVTKYCGKEEKLLLRSNFTSFPHYFIYIFLTSGVRLHIHLLNVVVQFIVLLTLSTLICPGTDISKCFSVSLGIRDNESRLYMWTGIPRPACAFEQSDKHFLCRSQYSRYYPYSKESIKILIKFSRMRWMVWFEFARIQL